MSNSRRVLVGCLGPAGSFTGYPVKLALTRWSSSG
jgi:hypothetical protein